MHTPTGFEPSSALPAVLPGNAHAFAFRGDRILVHAGPDESYAVPTLDQLAQSSVAGVRHYLGLLGVAPCVAVGPQGNLDLSLNGGAGTGYLDGGGNADVGIDLVGPGALASINLGTNVSGAGGDLRIGGSVVTYASIPSTGSGHANSASAARRT